MQRAFDSVCAENGISVEKGVTVKSLEAQIAMVKAGLGMAFVPSQISRFCRDDEVTFYSFTEDLPRRNVVAVSRKGESLTRVALAMIDAMKQVSDKNIR